MIVTRLNLKGIIIIDLIISLLIEKILMLLNFDNIQILGITILTSIILFNILSNIKILTKKELIHTRKSKD